MWNLFKRKTGRTSLVHAIFERCSGKVETVQRRYANILNAKVANWSASRIRVVLVIFIICYVGVTATVLLHAGRSTDNRIDVRPISYPKNVIPSGVIEAERSSEYITDRIRQFRRYLDSLRVNKGGRATYDSIMAVRPGLIDSLIQLETFDNKK